MILQPVHFNFQRIERAYYKEIRWTSIEHKEKSQYFSQKILTERFQ